MRVGYFLTQLIYSERNRRIRRMFSCGDCELSREKLLIV